MKRSSSRRRSSRRDEAARRRRTILSAVLAVLIVIGLGGTLASIALVGYYSQGLPSLDSLRESNLSQTTTILDRNGTPITSLFEENRTVVPITKISPALQDATISVEDRTFYAHQGVDYRRVAIAIVYDLSHRSAQIGGSTITQQVVKNLVLCNSCSGSGSSVSGLADRSASRKIREVLLAEELERRYSKQQILELYLNSIFYGNRAFGIEAAAQTYFGVSAAALTLPQASFLAGLPQSPSAYNPFGTPEQRAATRTRWRQVLDAMVANKKITPDEADAAFRTDIFKALDDRHKAVAASAPDPLTAHFVDYLLHQYLPAHGYDEATVLRGGFRITTTLDLKLQRMALDQVGKAVAQARAKGANTGAVLALDPKNGEILAMVGSADYNSDDIQGQVNLTLVGRQPGSSFKPYTYGYALTTGRYTAATPVNDRDATIGGTRFSDWDGRTEGYLPLRVALEQSRNLPALWTYKDVGPVNVIEFAHRLGVRGDFDPTTLTTTIGSADVRMIDHAAAYAAFDNGGFRVYPHPVLKMVDGAGRALPAFPEATPGQQVISPQVAYLMTSMLHGVPGKELGMDAFPVAGKTGTTESWTSAWMMGYTPGLVVGTFMGHINKGDTCNSGFANLASSDVKTSGWICPTNVLWGEHVGEWLWAPLLKSYYGADPGRWPATWKMPTGIVQRTVCRLDGQLATPTTPADQKFDELFIQGTGEPKGNCGSAVPPGATPYPSPSPSASPTPSPSGAPPPGSPPPSPVPSGSPVPVPLPSPSPSPSGGPAPSPSPSPKPSP